MTLLQAHAIPFHPRPWCCWALLLTPADLYELRNRPQLSQPVSGPPVLWPAPFHLSSSTTTGVCSNFRGIPLFCCCPHQWRSRWVTSLSTDLLPFPGLCFPKTHIDSQPLPPHHPPLYQPLPRNTSDSTCPNVVHASPVGKTNCIGPGTVQVQPQQLYWRPGCS